MQTFPIRRSRWGLLFLVPRLPERRQATIDSGRLALRMGILGRADVPIDRIASVGTAMELSMVAASVGMASNLAALRALATEGIQRGHMGLHARSVAIAAGASGADVERVATRIHAAGDINVDHARRVLSELRVQHAKASSAPPPAPAE